MNCNAMSIPQPKLLGELERCIERKTQAVAARNTRYGSDRVKVVAYMENLGWPDLFGYDMNHFLDDAEFSIEQHLRRLIFWADNVDDDVISHTRLQADVGMYWDMTLFGMRIRHSRIGVPEFLPHPFQQRFDPSTLGRFSFTETGKMPDLLGKYRRMQEVAATRYDGKISIAFPSFQRGPLDIYIQLRGYEGFIQDMAERPEDLLAMLYFLVDERLRFTQERQKFLEEESLPESTFVADDWVNIPFISPRFFRDTVMPVYAHIREQEGPVTGFHTCGNMGAIANDLLQVFPEMTWLDASAWNDLEYLDRTVDPRIHFNTNIINTISLGDHAQEQADKLGAIRAVGAHRTVGLTAQAILNLYPPFEDTLARLNRFLGRAFNALECASTA